MGLVHFYSHIDSEHKTEKVNGKLSYLYPEYDWSNAVVLVGGQRVSSDYEIKDDDVVFIRRIPTAATTVLTVVSIVGAVAAGIIAGISLYKANKAQEEAEDAIKNNASSTDVDKLPFLKGANNSPAQGQTFPYIIGDHYFTPYRLCPKYYEVSGVNGVDEYVNLILEAGFNPLIIKKIWLGNICIFNNENATEKTDGLFAFDEGTYYDAENLIEIKQSDEFTTDAFTKKIVSNYYNTEIANDYGTESADIEPVVKQLEDNTMSMDICILFDGLRKVDENTSAYVSQKAVIKAYWSNLDSPDPDDDADWTFLEGNNTFLQQQKKVTATKSAKFTYVVKSYKKQLDEDSIKQNAVNNVSSWTYVSGDTNTPSTASFSDLSDFSYVTTQEFIWVSTEKSQVMQTVYVYTCSFTDSWKTTEYVESYSDEFIYNSKSQMRFIAHKDFTPEEAFGKQITVRLIRSTPCAESNSQEKCYLYFINSQIYDENKSSSSSLVACQPLEDDKREMCTRIGIRMKATEDNESLSDSVSIEASAMARVWQTVKDEDGNSVKVWTPEKEETRNPAAWLLEIMTSDHHAHSKYEDDELDLDSFGAWYEYCDTNELFADGVITESKTKQDIEDELLQLGNATLFLNSDGLFEIAIDKAEENPVALLNTQNVRDISISKDFSRKTNGRKITFVNRESWTEETVYYMKDGTNTHSASDSISELAPKYITTYDHAVKYARRDIAMAYLQPKEVTVEVSREGAYYPLYSCVDVQLPQLANGITSSVIRGTSVVNDLLYSIDIADYVTFSDGYKYGIIIQAVTDSGHSIITAKVKGEGTTKTLLLNEDINVNNLDVQITAGAILSFGLLDDDGEFTYIKSRMKIYGVEAVDNGYKLKLKEYNAAIYEDGEIPAYKSTVSPKSDTTKQPIESASALADLSEQLQQNTAEQIEEVKGLIDVANKYTLDLTPEYQVISVNSSGSPYSQDDLKINCQLYYQNTALTGVTYTATVNEVEGVGTMADGVFTLPISAITSDNTVVKITATYTSGDDTVTRTASSTIAKLYAESSWTQYDMTLSDNAVSVDADGVMTPETISAEKIKRTADGQNETNYGHITAVIDDDKSYPIEEYNKDDGSGFDSEYTYNRRMTPFILTINSGEDALSYNNDCLLFFYRHN